VGNYRLLRNFDWGVRKVDDADALCIDVEILRKLCVVGSEEVYIGTYLARLSLFLEAVDVKGGIDEHKCARSKLFIVFPGGIR
jgi:hypothetical protein